MKKMGVFITLLMIILAILSCRAAEVQPKPLPTVEVVVRGGAIEPQTIEESEAEGDPGLAKEKGEGDETAAEGPVRSDAEGGGIPEGDKGRNNSGEQEESAPESAAGFTDVEWTWLSLSMRDEQEVVLVAEPKQYTLEFSEDGTFIFQADCNRGSGSYSMNEEQIALDLGTTTLAACQDGSMADQYIQYLRDVHSYEFDFSQLKLNLAAPQGTLIFSQGYVAGPESVEIDITGTAWHWIEFSDPESGLLIVDDPANYEIVLLAGGELRVRADCNDFSGAYEIEGNSLTMRVDAEVGDACGPDSLWESFVRDLNGAALYFIMEEDLFIDLMYDSGTMRFENGGTVEG